MFAHRFAKFSLRRSAWILFIILMLAICGAWARTSRDDSESHASTSTNHRFTAVEIQKRGFQICLTFSDSVRMVSPPEYMEQNFPATHTGLGRSLRRGIWTATYEADGKSYFLDFNDMTGNLIGIRPHFIETIKAARQIETAEASASIARMRMQEMGLVPAGAKIQLKGVPIHQDNLRTWKTTWSVTGPDSREPYQIQFSFSDVDGKPYRMISDREAKTYL